jgi:hypothetical protein
MGGSRAETIRQPRDRLKGHPQERQHSACHFFASDRESGTECPRRGVHYNVREGSKSEGPRPGIPFAGSKGLGTREPGPATPDAPESEFSFIPFPTVFR